LKGLVSLNHGGIVEQTKYYPSQHPSQQPSARFTEEGERFNRTLFAAIDALGQGSVSYALIGGVAASGLGRPRSTHDIDIFVRPEDAEVVLECLKAAEFKIERTDPLWLYKAWKEDILVDVIFKSSGDIYFDEEMEKHAKVIHYHGRDVPMVSPEDLVIIKSAVHNEIGPHHWHDALAILSHASLDWEYLLKRARRAPRRLLALLIYAQSNDIWVPNHVVFELFHGVFEEAKNYHRSPQKQFVYPSQVTHASHGKHSEVYIAGRIKDALASDERAGGPDLKIIVGERHIVVRGDSSSESQRKVIEEIIKDQAPGFEIDNQIRIPVLPGPEGAEYII
jgi:predicted nucleotidyltransferase